MESVRLSVHRTRPDSHGISSSVGIPTFLHLSIGHDLTPEIAIWLRWGALDMCACFLLALSSSTSLPHPSVPSLEHYLHSHSLPFQQNPESCLPSVQNAGSVFLGPYSSESCGDYASGTNHTLPTYGYARMYSGVSTTTFQKHITAQCVTKEGLANIGPAVATLAALEKLDAHRNAILIRQEHISRNWKGFF